jgi:PAS domain S-box-containing protein
MVSSSNSSHDNSGSLYNSRIIKNYVEYAKRVHPDVDMDSILNYAGIARYEVDDQSHWFTQAEVDRFHEILTEKTGDPNISREVGRYAASSQATGTLRQYALGFMTPGTAYWMLEKISSNLSRAFKFETRQIASDKMEVLVKPRPGVKEKPHQCENRMGLLESMAKLFTNKYARVEHPDCIHKGAEVGRYIITWEKTPFLIWKQLRNYFSLASIAACLGLFFFLPVIHWVMFVLGSALLTVLFWFFSANLETKELTKTIETQGNAAKDLLFEMDIRYRNVLLIKEIGQATSTLMDTDELVETVVNAMEKRLDFDRGMIMLANKNETRLIYGTGYGYGKEQEDFLHQTEFHLDNPESRGLFVLSFKEQKPFLINDIAEIEESFSKRSLELARQMGVRALICVPIVYGKKSLGILAVDNTRSKRVLTQSDMSLLMGVASQTAINIIEAMSIQKLQESEEKYRSILESVEEGYFEVDLAGNLTFFNDSLCKILGYSRKELSGLNNRNYTSPKTAKKMYRIFSEIYRTGNPALISDYEVIRKNETNPHVVEISASLIRDSSGGSTGFRGVVRDVTERRQAEKALRESEEKYRELVENANSIILRRDIEGKITFFNEFAQKFFGYAESDIIGKNMSGTILPDTESAKRDLVELVESLQQDPERQFVSEDENILKNGKTVWIAWTYKPIFNENDKLTEVLCIGNDITELKRAEYEKKDLEAQLQVAQKMEAIGTLAGGIAHDFNNILQSIFSYTQILLMKKEADDPDFSKIEAIIESVKRASDLTKRLLIFSRKVKSKLRPLNLNNEVVQIVKMLDRMIPKMVNIEIKLAGDLKSVNGDPVQIEQIMMNLGVNARDAMPDGGNLTFETKNITLDKKFCKTHLGTTPGEYVLLSVSDTGQGMEKDVQTHIFEPFFTTKEAGKGTGLGLAMVYGIVQSHGGYVTCKSEPGQGTTFSIYFPVVQLKTQEPEVKKVQMPVRGGNETILLVDDEESIRKPGEEMLASVGYKVLTAPDGERALEIFSKQHENIALIILDLILPGMGGRQCLEKILKVNPLAQVIVTSGYAVDGPVKETIDTKAKRFVSKPYDGRELLKFVREVLDKN